jgi:translation initiation factor 1 (eIF-1/SUI1)
MSTGKATIRGRNGTSTSGAKVSQYSPQYRQITGQEAQKRGTTSYDIATSNLTQEQKNIANTLELSKAQVLALNQRQISQLSSNLKNASAYKISMLKKMYGNVSKNQLILSGNYKEVGLNQYQAKQYIQKQQAKLYNNQSGKPIKVSEKDYGKKIVGYNKDKNGNKLTPIYRTKYFGSPGDEDPRVRSYEGRQVERWKIGEYTIENLAKSVHTQGDWNYVLSIARNSTVGLSGVEKKRIQVARAYIQRTSEKDYSSYFNSIDNYDKYNKTANQKINSRLSDSDKSKIEQARKWVIDHSNNKVELKEYFAQLDNSKRDKNVVQYESNVKTKDQKAQREKEYQTRLKQKEYNDNLEPNLKEYAGDSKLKQAIADIYEATATVENLKTTSKKLYGRNNIEFNTATKGKSTTWSTGLIEETLKLQKLTENLVNEKNHPYLEVAENTIQSAEGIPAGLLKAADYGIQTKGKSLKPQAKNFIQGTVESPVVVGNSGYKYIKSGGKDLDSLQVLSDATAMLMIGKIGGKAAKDTISNLPGVRRVKVQEIKPGASTNVRDINVGYSLSTKNKPILSYSKESGLVKGALEIPLSKIEGLQVQAFTKLNTATFERTVLNQLGEVEGTYFKSGKNIASKVYKQSKSVTKPKGLDILSEHIPQSMKSIVKDTIVNYSGLLKRRDIQVYGSVAQKLQMEGFLSRSPKDIEVSVSSTSKFISSFRARAKKAGFVEGKHYRITGSVEAPKIEFYINGKWEKGVEVFSHKNSMSTEEVTQGYRSEEGIAYGFSNLKSIKADSVKMMKLQEQTARKFAGATTLKEGKIQPVHEGRVKDVRDLIEIGTAYELTKNIGIARDILNYTKIAVEKHPEILESPVIKYINENGKLPSVEQIKNMNMNSAKSFLHDTELIFESKSKRLNSSALSRPKLIQSKPISSKSKSSKATSKSSKQVSKPSKQVSKSSKATSKPSRSVLKSSKATSKPSRSVSRASESSKPIQSKSKTVKKQISSKSNNSNTLSKRRYRPKKSKITRSNYIASFESLFGTGTSKKKTPRKPTTTRKPTVKRKPTVNRKPTTTRKPTKRRTK